MTELGDWMGILNDGDLRRDVTPCAASPGKNVVRITPYKDLSIHHENHC